MSSTWAKGCYAYCILSPFSDPTMDRKLLDLLVCPSTRQPLHLLDKAALAALNQAIANGTVTRADGSAQTTALAAALITHDRKTLYRLEDDIPVLLSEDAISSAQIADFTCK